MPGHKRKEICNGFPYGLDITEINGFDDLHEPEGILKEAQEQAAKLYDAKEAYYLVNGSTCGILAAISASVPVGGTVLVARNCHKAVYHAIQLRNAKAIYIYPAVNEYGIAGAIEKNLIEEAIVKYANSGGTSVSKIDACILTSPTYEGVVSDIREIAELLHTHNIPLIVDEAHGAHFGFNPIFPENATRLGADVVVTSIHKTLPAPTQTALLLMCSERIEPAKLKLYLDIYETSSPSYVLMSAMQQALNYVKNNNDQWEKYSQKLKNFYKSVDNLTNVRVERTDDPSKIILLGSGIGDILRKEYAIEVEMESYSYAVLMTSLMDSSEGYQRLIQALVQMDSSKERNAKISEGRNRVCFDYFATHEKAKCSIGEAIEADKEKMELFSSSGRIAGEYVYLYPPGIPVLVPGEEITKEALSYLKECKNEGLSIKGPESKEYIWVLK